MILQNWPVMLVQVGLLRICVDVPEGCEAAWAAEALGSFLLAFVLVCSTMYLQAKRTQGRLSKAYCIKEAAGFLGLGVLMCWLVFWACGRVQETSEPFVWPVIMMGT